MRDAFGGVFMMRLLLVFLVVLVAFTTVSFKYAKSFRVKNKIIDFVEQNQIREGQLSTFFGSANGANAQKLENILESYEYDNSCAYFRNYDEGAIEDDNATVGYCIRGALIMENVAKSGNGVTYYNVYTYVNWNLGILNTILALGGQSRDSQDPIEGAWTIKGEAVVKG